MCSVANEHAHVVGGVALRGLNDDGGVCTQALPAHNMILSGDKEGQLGASVKCQGRSSMHADLIHHCCQ